MTQHFVDYRTPPCIVCHKTGTIKVLREHLEQYEAGTKVQHAFPEMPAELREQIMTGTHPACWDILTEGMDE